MSSADQLLSPGDLIAGKYRIERLLAQGGYGAVFVAENTSTEALVALKVLWPYLQTPDLAARFELEARVAGRLRSDFVVRTLDAGKDAETGLLYLVMELLEGESLAERVKTGGPLSPQEVVRFLIQTASALDKAHAHVGPNGNLEPIVHRDLKPDNLFLCQREGAQPIIKVLDFGIAKVVTADNSVSQDIKATPLFMAYEQASGDPVGPWTDIWALGLNAFYLLTGEHYWLAGREGIGSLFYEVLGLEIVPPSQRARDLGLEPDWPEAFDVWFLRCVNRDVTARFQKAGHAATALAEALLGAVWAETMPAGVKFDSIIPAEQTLPPVSSNVRSIRPPRPSSPGERTLMSAGRPRVWWAAAALAVVGVSVAAAAATYWSLGHGPNETQHELATVDSAAGAAFAGTQPESQGATKPGEPSALKTEPSVSTPGPGVPGDDLATQPEPNPSTSGGAAAHRTAPPKSGAGPAGQAPSTSKARVSPTDSQSASKPTDGVHGAVISHSERRTDAATPPPAGVYSER